MPAPEEIDPQQTAAQGPDETAVEVSEVTSHNVHPGDSLQARLDPSAGPTRLGRYVLLREIGRGAIGVVYVAYHEGLDRKLAIKVLNKQRAGRQDLEARLKREARALAKLSHPNVVQVYDVGEFAGRVFVAMEFVDGQPLSDWMRRPHAIAEIIAMFAAAGRGLAAAHEAGVIHRDFKPDNVLVGEDGRPRVLDFGLARAAEHDSEDAVHPVAKLRESGPIAASLDQLLGTSLRSRTIGDSSSNSRLPVPTPEYEYDPDATIDAAAPPRPEPAADQDLILTQTGVAMAELHALELEPATAIPANESSRVDATLAPDHAPNTNALATAIGESTSSLFPPHLERSEDEFAETVCSDVGHGSIDADDVLTRTGAMMGTPAYMSPEQFLGLRVDQASDQFSFCVALYEALYGHRPFVGKTPLDLATATQEGAIVDAPPHTQVPAWLRAIVVRGLSPSPDDRFESMHELIAELERDREPKSRRAWLGAGLLAVAAVALALGRLLPGETSPCPSIETRAAELWTDARAGELRATFERSPLPYAAATWTAVEPRLQTWTHSWAEQRVEACEATHVRHEFSAEVLDLRQACLDRQRRSYEALLEQLQRGDATVIEHAVEATLALPDPRSCADVDALLSGLAAPPADVAKQVEQLRAELAGIDAMAHTGNSRASLSLVADAVTRARASGYDPVVAEALLTHGRSLAGAGEGEQAIAILQDALDEAERSGHAELIPQVASELVSISIYLRPDPIRGRVWARRAMASLDHLGTQGLPRARALRGLANLDRLDGAYVSAEAQFEQVLELLDSPPERAIVLNDLGNAIAGRGDAARARAIFEQALAEASAAFGAGHPRVGHTCYNLAKLEFDQGQLDDARRWLERARDIYVAARGPEHRDVGSVELLLAAIDVSVGEFDDAETHARLADRIYAAELAPDNVDRAEPQLQLGHIAFARKQFAIAAEHYRTALAQQRASLPPGHISMADTYTNLGLVQLAGGDAEAAVPELQRAVELLEAGAGVDPEALRRTRLYLGDALLMRAAPGDVEQAKRRFDAALVGCDGGASESQLCPVLRLRASGEPPAVP